MSRNMSESISSLMDALTLAHSFQDIEQKLPLLTQIGDILMTNAHRPNDDIQKTRYQFFRQCSMLILGIGFQSIPSDNTERESFTAMLENGAMRVSPKSFPEFRGLFHVLLWLVENHWKHPILARVLTGAEVDQTEVDDWPESTIPELLKVRVEILANADCKDYALNLCRWCSKLPSLSTEVSVYKVYFRLLHKFEQMDEFTKLCKEMQCCLGLRVIEASLQEYSHILVLLQTFLSIHWLMPTTYCCTKKLLFHWMRVEWKVAPQSAKFLKSVSFLAQRAVNSWQSVTLIETMYSLVGPLPFYRTFYLSTLVAALRTDRVRLTDDVAKRDQTTARLVYCCLVMVTTSSTWCARLRQAAMVTAFSLSRRLDAYYAVKEAYSEYRGNVDDAAFAVGEDLIVEVLTNLSALREGYLDPSLGWATLQAMCLYHLYGGNAHMYGSDVQLHGGNVQMYGGNVQLHGCNTQNQMPGCNTQLGNTQLYGGNAQLYGGNTQNQMHGCNTQLYSGNGHLYGANTQMHTQGIVLGHGDAPYRIDLVNTPQGRQLLKPGILQHLLTSGRNNRQLFEGQQGVGRQEVVCTTPAEDDCIACELPSQNSRPLKISIVDITQNKAALTKLNQPTVTAGSVSSDMVTDESGSPTNEPAETVRSAVIPAKTVNPAMEPTETVICSIVPAETVSSAVIPGETVNPAMEITKTVSSSILPAESGNPASEPTESGNPDIVPAESTTLASKDVTPTVRVIHDYQASYVAYVGQTKSASLESLPAVMGPPESWEVHVPESSLHWRRRKGSQFGGIKREPTPHRPKKNPRQPTPNATKRPSKPEKIAQPMITRTCPRSKHAIDVNGACHRSKHAIDVNAGCRRSKHAIDVNAAFPYQMELEAENPVELRHKCGVCSAICGSRLLVVKHMWEKHNIHLKRLRGYDKAVVCNICGQVYVQHKCMMKHMREHGKGAQGVAPSRMKDSDDCSDETGLLAYITNSHQLVSIVTE